MSKLCPICLSVVKKQSIYCSKLCYYKSKKGKLPWNKGLKGVMPEPWNKGTKGVCKSNSGTFRKGKMNDEKHFQWKGENAGYRAIHSWVERKLGKPSACRMCGVKGFEGHKIHWANKSGKYLRIKSDWVRLCCKCHGLYDKNKRVGNQLTE